MGLPRKDIRLKLDHDMHAACKAIAEAADLDPAEWCEQVIVDVIVKRVHAANLLVLKLEASGSLGKFREDPG